MPKFPIAEAEVIALAQQMISGLTANPTLFPAPPVAVAALQSDLTAFVAARTALAEAQANAERLKDVKDADLEALTTAMAADLRYAEAVTGDDDAELKSIGWGARAPRTALRLPGQVRALEATRTETGTIFLDWKEPVRGSGGKVAFYRVQSRLRSVADAPWQVADTVIPSQATLAGLERGKEYEFQVIAVNATGDGLPSNVTIGVS